MKFKLFNSKEEALSTLPNNKPKLVLADNKEVCLVRKNDELYAFDNLCPHMGEQLHKGITNHLDQIICPLHAYKFDMRYGSEVQQKCKDLNLYEIRSTSEGTFLVC